MPIRNITGVNDGGDLFLNESTSTTTNTGIVERNINAVNESELFTNGATSTVLNTGVIERSITGVNESEEMFPDNTESTVLNISTILRLLNILRSRSTYYENEIQSINLMSKLQNC